MRLMKATKAAAMTSAPLQVGQSGCDPDYFRARASFQNHRTLFGEELPNIGGMNSAWEEYQVVMAG